MKALFLHSIKVMRIVTISIILSLFLILGCKSNTELAISRPIEVFRTSSDTFPIISAHRGGKGIKGYPENCLETMIFIQDSIRAMFEIDIAKTKDNVLVLMHDNSLDRTTTGTGRLSKYTLEQLNSLYLKDDFNTITSFKIPTLKKVLNWAKANGVFLTLDIKRSVKVNEVIDLIRAEDAQDNSIIITYDLQQAKRAYQLAPELLLSVSARNEKEWETILNSGIPTKNMLAFTGTRLSKTILLDNIHKNNVLSILGTLGNLDSRAKTRGNHLYHHWYMLGSDIIATDRPFEVFEAIN